MAGRLVYLAWIGLVLYTVTRSKSKWLDMLEETRQRFKLQLQKEVSAQSEMNARESSHDGTSSLVVNQSKVIKPTSADLPDVVLRGMIVVKIKSVSYVRELSNPKREITKKLTLLCEKEMAKIFQPVKGKQTTKIGSFRQGRRNKVVLVMDLDSTGNGNASEITEIINKNIKNPGKFIYYDVDQRMARFQSFGVCCQPRLHYSFNNQGKHVAYDFSGFDNNGDVKGRVHVTNRGKCGKGAMFKNGYVTVRNFKQTKTSKTDSIAIIFWIRTLKARTNSSILRTHYDGAVTEVSLQNGFFEWVYITQDETTVFRIRHGTRLWSRVWAHVACIYDPYINTAKMYIDGKLSREIKLRRKLIHWKFTGWLRFGLPESEGFLDDLYVYDCILGDDIIKSIRRTCMCVERCAPRGNNEFLIRLKLFRKRKSKTFMYETTKKVEKEIKKLFDDTAGEQEVQTLGYRPVDIDKIMVDYSLRSAGNSDMKHLAGVLQPAAIAGRFGEVTFETNDLKFVPLSGTSVCRSSEMKCNSGECINKLWKCDGEINCADGSDEINCATPFDMNCDNDEYQCNTSRVLGISDCVKENYRCDGQLDCADDSDEKNCLPPKLVTAPRSLVILAEGESSTCRCAATGVPTPIVSWHKNGREVLSKKDKIMITSISGRGTLTITNLEHSDTGDYICNVRDNRVTKVIAPSCTIQVRAFGKVCVPPFFNSAAQRNSECQRCFCHYRTTNCQSAKLYRSQLSSNWDCYNCKEDEMRLVGRNGRPLRNYDKERLLDRELPRKASYYWKLPIKYVGNKLTSYGGKLRFSRDSGLLQNSARREKRSIDRQIEDLKPWNYVPTGKENRSWFDKPRDEKNLNNVPVVEIASLDHEIARYYRTKSTPKVLNLTEYHQVVIVGNDKTELVSAKPEFVNRNAVEVRIHEDSWKDRIKGVFVTRDILLSVLTDIKYIFINAKRSDTTLSRLTSVSLDTAMSEENGNDEVNVVEHCACPLGYKGLSCEECSEGYFRSKQTNTCMKCSCFNHSTTCDHWTAECKDCQHGTQGPNCQNCKPGSYGNAKQGTPNDCQPCKCPLSIETNQFSELCYLDSDGKQTCTKCETGYAGRNCERCAEGYDGNPSNVGGSCYKVGNFSQCDMKGSVSQNVTKNGEIKCICKANVFGSLCQKCSVGSFNLHASNPSGCVRCFCNRVSQTCTSLSGVKKTISASFKEDLFILKTIRSSQSLFYSKPEKNGVVHLRKTFSNGSLLKKPLYWKLPKRFAGSKVEAYGSYLEYSITYSWYGHKELSLAHDVLMLGNKFGIIYVGRKLRRIKYKNNEKQTFRVLFDEKLWRFSSGRVASKHLFLLFLAKMDKIMILATPMIEMKEVILHDVKMEHVVETKEGKIFRKVETCSCPEGYIGHSCEICASGYTKVSGGLLPRCAKCNCHGHSSQCDIETGQCKNCQHNTAGKHCEKCVTGFYGDATTGSISDCRPCPCPYPKPPNRFSFTCFMDEDRFPVCDNCPEGHEGSRCERCKPSHVGNPMALGDYCKPVSSCGCDARGSRSEQCDDKTRKCSCKKNVQGEKCTECKPGYYNLQSSNPDGCFKCFCMGFRTTCKSQDFYREQIYFKPSLIVPDGLSITTENLSKSISNFLVDRSEKRVRFQNISWLQREDIYWTLPRMFLGSQVMSYGGTLKFSYFYASSGRRISQTDGAVRLQGPTLILYYRRIKYIESNKVNDIEVILLEKYWQKPDGRAPSRTEFLKVLVQIDAILIRASFTKRTNEISLGEIRMNIYSDENHRQVNAPEVEICKCPQNYLGTSCESCIAGYTRNGNPFGPCVPCQCNSHSKECDQRTGKCKNCQDNTSGKHCELCTRGFYGDPTKGTRKDCKQCLCPLAGSINRFSETCFLAQDGLPTCDSCQEGYSGRRCEKCSLDYTGNPLTPGGKCFKVPVELIPKVKIIPGKITLQEQDSISFHCQVKTIRPTQILWSRRDGKPLPKGANATGNTLSFKHVRISDAGKYICTANSDIALRMATTLLVVKKQQVSAVIVSVAPKSRYIPVGGTAKFTCSSKTSSRYSITWTRENNKPMPSSVHVQDGTLVVSNAQISDGGTYICTGKNALNTDRAIVSLHVGVVVKPQVVVSPKVQIVDIAQAVTFRCSASSGFPAPTLKWKRGGNKDLPLFSNFVRGLFRILAVSRRDEGEYMCIASNTGGASVMKVRLLVKGPNSSPKASILSTSLSVDEGKRVVLECKTSGDEKLKIRWSRKNGRLPKSAIVKGEVLEIKKVSEDDKGVYTCIVKNRYGQAKAKAKLDVKKDYSKKPKVFIKPEGPLIPIMEGKSLVLHCHVANISKPSIKWQSLSKEGYIGTGPVLKLDKVKSDDTGVYVCLAKTKDGDEKASVSVVVESEEILPKVVVRPKYVEVREGGEVTFTCKAKSEYPVKVYWVRADKTRLGENFINKDNVLTVQNVRRKDEGRYICLATNRFGSSKDTADLRINWG